MRNLKIAGFIIKIENNFSFRESNLTSNFITGSKTAIGSFDSIFFI